jgi:hypothetical protein
MTPAARESITVTSSPHQTAGFEPLEHRERRSVGRSAGQRDSVGIAGNQPEQPSL